MYRVNRWIFCILFCGIFQLYGITQLNLKIGYNPTIGSFSTINNLLQNYQPATGELQREFGSLRFLHGIQLGVRYKMGLMSFEMGWDHLNKEQSALIFRSDNESFSERNYSFSINALYAGFNSYLGKFGYGASIMNTNYVINRAINDNDLNLINDRKWGIRLNLNWVAQQSKQVS